MARRHIWRKLEPSGPIYALRIFNRALSREEVAGEFKDPSYEWKCDRCGSKVVTRERKGGGPDEDHPIALEKNCDLVMVRIVMEE